MRQGRRRREPRSSREGPLQRALAVASAPAQRAPGPILVVANFTAAIAVAVVDAVIGGAAVALAVGIAFGTSLAVAVVIGAATAVIAVGAALRYQHTRREAGTLHPVLFPSGAP
jgi:hypothetical protein